MSHPVAVIAVATTAALLAVGGVLTAARSGLEPWDGPWDGARDGARIAKSADGHFWAQAEVDGRPVRLLVDTGASAVTLTAADARRLGLDLADLRYDRRVFTAAGRTRAARVTLDEVAVDGARIERVEALVVAHGLPESLLGMSYLGRLRGFDADRDALTLRP